jgi:hypothetical protein
MTWMTPKSTNSTLKKQAATRSKTSPLFRSTERVDNRVSAVSTHSPSSASSSLARSIPSRVGARQMGASRSGVSVSVAQDLDSILCDTSIHGARTNEQAAANKTLRIGAKRSFRNVFGRRDPRATPQPGKEQKSKRSSVASSALVQRIRNSTNLSQVSLVKPSSAKTESNRDPAICADRVETQGNEQDRKAAWSVLESTLETAPTEDSTQPAPPTRCETATVIQNILDRVASMKKDSPDCLRGLEIAEVCLRSSTHYS